MLNNLQQICLKTLWKYTFPSHIQNVSQKLPDVHYWPMQAQLIMWSSPTNKITLAKCPTVSVWFYLTADEEMQTYLTL